MKSPVEVEGRVSCRERRRAGENDNPITESIWGDRREEARAAQ